MKKFFRIFAVAALLCTTLVACEDKFDDYTPADPVSGVQAYFSNESATDVTVTKADSQVEVTLMRGDAMTAASVPITASIDAAYASLFNVPATANFETGKTSTSVVITFDGAQLTDGAKYQITLMVGDDVSTPYGKNQTTLNISVPEPYVLLGKGLYRDDIVASAYNVGGFPEYEVEIYENLNTPGYIYIKNAYTHEYPVSGLTISAGYEGDSYFAINIEDPNEVFLPVQYLGIEYGSYGKMKVGTSLPGKLENNIITFPVKAFVFSEDNYNGGAWYMNANNNGMFRLCLPGAVLTDFSLDLSYSGIRAGADNSIRPVVDAVFGADVAEIQYAVVPGNVQYDGEAVAAAIAGMADESIVSATVAAVDQNEEDEVLSVELVAAEAVEAGIYTMVAVPFDAEGNAQTADAAAVAFYVNSINTDVPEVDFKATVMSANELFAMFGEEGGFSDSDSMAWFATGSNISTWKQLTAGAAAVQGLLDKGVTLEQIALANGSDWDLNYINNDGYDYNYYQGLAPETSYMVIHYVEDLYGNTKTVGSIYTTAPAEKVEVNKSVLKKADGVKLEGGVANLFE